MIRGDHRIIAQATNKKVETISHQNDLLVYDSDYPNPIGSHLSLAMSARMLRGRTLTREIVFAQAGPQQKVFILEGYLYFRVA